ncbi:MAG: nucleotidyltransferase domain-containing protein [Candidatus Atribacteria bacterium]|nr:nucleotidyltransferase domain-containing protein [Candidatus Atribacteria bacterium]
MREDYSERIRHFVSENDNILLVFLFGSFVKGIPHEESDIDLGIYFRKVPPTTEFLHLWDSLSEHLQREVDMVLLNTTDPIIRMQILKYGVLIKKDPRAYSDFFIRTLNEYDDLKYYRKEIEKNILRGRIYA